MKIFLVTLIIFSSYAIGYYYKSKLNQKYLFLNYIKEFHSFYMSNIILFKNNIVEIIDNYIIMQNNKNAKFNKLFSKNNNLYSYNEEFLNNTLLDKNASNIILQYLQQMGKNEYEFEREKNKNISEILKIKINESFENVNKKGDLYLKILLSIGAIISILIW